MQDQNDSEPKEQNSVDASTEESKSIFSETEVRETVKGFVSAWLKGEVKIHFITIEELKNVGKMTSKNIGEQEALDRALSVKKEFTERIMICSNAKKATLEEQRKAVSLLFEDILLYRCGGRIEGQFAKTSMNERLDKIEQGLKVTNDLVQQLIDLHRQELGL